MRVGVAAFLVLATLLAGAPAQARRFGAPRTQAIDMVVIHSTGGPTCDAQTGQPVWIGAGTLDDNLRRIEVHPTLGIHYMIDRDGTLRASVPEGQIAHHVFHYSARSIAVELVNDGDGRDSFPPAQVESLVALLRDITQRHPVMPGGIKRHSDLDTAALPCSRTQRRKVDPGAAFPYEQVLERVWKDRP
jgi:N-acetylmuramoyl-L-alanine amidase